MRPLIVVSALLAIGCSTEPFDGISGSWTAPFAFGPYSALTIHLAEVGPQIKGTGSATTWQFLDTTIVAGPSYPVTVTGTDDHGAVNLQVSIQVGPGTSIFWFEGSVQDAAHVRGVIAVPDNSVGVTFTRT